MVSNSTSLFLIRSFDHSRGASERVLSGDSSRPNKIFRKSNLYCFAFYSRVIYSSASGGERKRMRAATAPRPTIGKKKPPLSSTEAAIKLTLAAMLLTATSVASREIIFGAVTRAKAGVATESKGKERECQNEAGFGNLKS